MRRVPRQGWQQPTSSACDRPPTCDRPGALSHRGAILLLIEYAVKPSGGAATRWAVLCLAVEPPSGRCLGRLFASETTRADVTDSLSDSVSAGRHAGFFTTSHAAAAPRSTRRARSQAVPSAIACPVT